MGLSNKGKYIRTEEHKLMQSLKQKGKDYLTKEQHEINGRRMKEWHGTHKHPLLGKRHSIETKLKMSKNAYGRKGNLNPRYIDGRTPLTMVIRNLSEMHFWRILVFEKDYYECQDCGLKGSPIEAHHEKSFALILDEFLEQYNQFSPIEDKETLTRLAMNYKPFWDINNGKTLCVDCHSKTKRGRGVRS